MVAWRSRLYRIGLCCPGFLREPDQSRLGDLQAVWPTLVVVDYAAERSGWLSEAILQLAQRHHGAPVRVLVLERAASGPS